MRKVAVVGFAPSTWHLAPFNDPAFEIWALPWKKSLPRCTRWFDIHRLETSQRQFTSEYVSKLASLPGIIYMQEVHPEIPNSRRYPIEHMIARYRDYFTSSFAYMIAMAIDERFDEIHIFGVDLCDCFEYVAQRPCAEWWCGYAEALGIKLVIPEQSKLLKQPYRYGYQDSLLGQLENAAARWLARQQGASIGQ